MSFDLNLATVCDHVIFRELSVMDPDLHTLRVSKPLVSSTGIQVFASDNLIPKTMYTVVFDPTATQDSQVRLIYFKNKWQSPTDFFEISYKTSSTYCPKCSGLNVIDDISYDVLGQLSTIRDEPLLAQNLEKWTITELNSNPFHAYIGTGLVQIIGQRIIDVDFMSARITQEISAALSRFQDLQGKYRLTGRTMTDGETLESVDDVQVKIDDNDPTLMRVDVTVTARSGKPLTFTQYMRMVA
jgi:hypothetical protein